jgi:hypothetical protein
MADLGIVSGGDEPTFHAPVFVVTHRLAETIVKRGGTSYVFVTEGIDNALVRGRHAGLVGSMCCDHCENPGTPQRDVVVALIQPPF